MISSEEIKITTEILLKGALLFAIIDIVFLTVLAKLIKPDYLYKMKWRLVILMAFFFCILYGIIVSIIFWDPVYCYVFPLWTRWIIPPSFGLLFSLIGLFFWWLAFRLPGNAVINFCILGGLWGITTHIFAVYRGILEKPPMLKGASPFAAILIAAFEFIFYWCICLGLISLFGYIRSQFVKQYNNEM